MPRHIRTRQAVDSGKTSKAIRYATTASAQPTAHALWMIPRARPRDSPRTSSATSTAHAPLRAEAEALEDAEGHQHAVARRQTRQEGEEGVDRDADHQRPRPADPVRQQP